VSDGHYPSPTDEADDRDELIVEPAPAPQRRGVMRRLASLRRIIPRVHIWRPRLTLFTVVLVVASFGMMLTLINSPLLEINTIDVEGADVVSAASVRQLVGLKGQHVLLADLEAARQRVTALPMIKQATVSRDWPSGIKVVIVERKPWGWWRANNTVWSFDSEGVILEGAAPQYSGPIVTQVSALPVVKAGEVVDLTVIGMVAELDQRGAPLPLPSILAYEWSLTDGLVVLTEHGRIVFGDFEGFEYKYSVWDELEREAQLRGEPLLFADLRFGLRPRVEIGLNVGRDIRVQDRITASVTE